MKCRIYFYHFIKCLLVNIWICAKVCYVQAGFEKFWFDFEKCWFGKKSYWWSTVIFKKLSWWSSLKFDVQISILFLFNVLMINAIFLIIKFCDWLYQCCYLMLIFLILMFMCIRNDFTLYDTNTLEYLKWQIVSDHK